MQTTPEQANQAMQIEARIATLEYLMEALCKHTYKDNPDAFRRLIATMQEDLVIDEREGNIKELLSGVNRQLDRFLRRTLDATPSPQG